MENRDVDKFGNEDIAGQMPETIWKLSPKTYSTKWCNSFLFEPVILSLIEKYLHSMKDYE